MWPVWIEKFKQAWHKADEEGANGSRVERGLEAAIPLAIFAYSEWLDSEKVLVPPVKGGDERTHEELVREFINYCEGN